ncbi:Aste57867_22944 [Aphanomyces stellatus]|uniref:Aste57867_22944 protein n=1 Tax=Aphanomyces stellatus TaxID=120398 RepID=A0A485LMF5_9STRA|nr:hypothetical protein As57867_022873 [Aphanomyces stellatus]VFT99594.1 Aste57867_22944 [Aphanomyces stellatus]
MFLARRWGVPVGGIVRRRGGDFYSTCDKISIHRQRYLLEIAQIAHEQQHPYSKYTNLSADFEVPYGDPWPPMAQGTMIQISLFRRAYKAGKMDAEVVAALDKINFVWDPRHHKWQLQVAALKRYKELFGDTSVPSHFTILPDDNEWDCDLWSIKLGQVVMNLRKRAASVPADIKAELDAIGFAWDAQRAVLSWDEKLAALVHFKALHGHVHVPQAFEVPDDDIAWPPALWKMHLGSVVNTLRCTEATLSATRRAALDAIGFVWDVSETTWSAKLAALETYRRKFGTVAVPGSFCVPTEDDEWPADTHAMKLGSVVNSLRHRPHLIPPERVAQLDALGFQWKRPKKIVPAVHEGEERE